MEVNIRVGYYQPALIPCKNLEYKRMILFNNLIIYFTFNSRGIYMCMLFNFPKC